MTADPARLARLWHLLAWLAPNAAALGLTQFGTAPALFEEIAAPALLLPALLGAPLSGAWAELGPGCGAAGFALAVLSPDAHLTLVDRRERVVSFLELAARRFALDNVSVLRLNLTLRLEEPLWEGVCFRALGPPTESLCIAAACARRWACAWHTPDLIAYDASPPGFDLAARSLTASRLLAATLYRRL